METNRETSVWQRVAAPPIQGPSLRDLRSLLMNAGERDALFRELSNQLSRGREQMKRIRELEQANLACLKGMLLFSQQEVSLPRPGISPAPARQRLIRSYYLGKKAAAEYTARSVDSEFGLVFQKMAAREIRVCTMVTQLLGEI